MATKLQNIQQTKRKLNLNLNYLKSMFTLDKREIQVYYESNFKLAEQETRHLAQGSETLLNMRDLDFYESDNLARSQQIKIRWDNDIRNNYISTSDSSILYMNRRLYELAVKFRIENKDIVGAEDMFEYQHIKSWRVYKNLKDIFYYSINNRVYDARKIRKVIGALMRARNYNLAVSVNPMHEYLTFYVSMHGILLFKPIQSNLEDSSDLITLYYLQ